LASVPKQCLGQPVPIGRSKSETQKRRRLASSGGCAGLSRSSNSDELKSLRIQLWGALGEVEHLDADHLILLVEIQDHPWRNLLRLDNRRVVKAQVKSVGFAVNLQFHSLPFIVRSKYTLTTRSGTTVL